MVKKKLTAGSKKAIAATEMRNSAKAQKIGGRRECGARRRVGSRDRRKAAADEKIGIKDQH